VKFQKITEVGRKYRRAKRYRQIVAILMKYGWSDFFDWLKGDSILEKEEIGLQASMETVTRAVRLRLAFTELGSTFIKLAQLLSSRPDVVPPHVVFELSKLQDKVPPFPYKQVQEIFQREFNALPEDLFQGFDPIPIASASIGQVHQAWLIDGRKVAIKVQRPNLRKLIETDIEIMLNLCAIMERNSSTALHYEPTRIVKEFSRSISKEIDYVREAANMMQFRRMFESNPHVYIPEMFTEFSSSTVLTMEFVDGIKITHFDELKQAGIEPREVNDICADFFLEQVFEKGMFHADPHPGNIFILPKGPTVCLLDFGIVGMIDQQAREVFIDLLDGIIAQNPRNVADAVLALTQWDELPNRKTLEQEIQDFIPIHINKPLKEIRIGIVLQDLLHILSRHRLRLPSNFFMMLRAFSIAEGLSLMLNPDFDMMTKILPFAKRMRLERFSPKRLTADVLEMIRDMGYFMHRFPKDILEITHLLRNRQMRIQIEHLKMNQLIEVADQVGNRIVAGLVLIGLLITSAILLAMEVPPLFQGTSLLGIILFLTSTLLGFIMLRRIFKRQKW